jgi:hypothetical protein
VTKRCFCVELDHTVKEILFIGRKANGLEFPDYEKIIVDIATGKLIEDNSNNND